MLNVLYKDKDLNILSLELLVDSHKQHSMKIQNLII